MSDQRTERTPEKKPPRWREPFLETLAKTGNVVLACKTARVGRRTVYDARDRHPKFRERWDAAIEESVDYLEAEARRRALHGVDTPVYHNGKKVDTVKKYSDVLLMFLLKGNRPEKFRDNFDLKRLINDLAALQSSTAEKPAAGGTEGD